MATTWIGNVFNVQTKAVKQTIGKKKVTVATNYYCSFVGTVSGGRTDKILEIEFDGTRVWTGSVKQDDDDFVRLTLDADGTSVGNLNLYWGTETTTLSPLLTEALTNNQRYTAMRGICYLIGDSIYLGQDRTTVPNIQVKISRFPAPAWLPVPPNIQDDANPIAAFWAAWTDKRFGLGRSEDDLDIPRLSAAARQLWKDDIGISPFINEQMSMQDMLLKLFEHIDGYPTSYGGKFGIELIRPTTAVIPRLTTTDLKEDPKLDAEHWNDTFNQTRVKFPDNSNFGLENIAKYNDLANFRVMGRPKPQDLQREWFTRLTVALRAAGALGRLSGIPQTSGSVVLRESRSTNLNVGSPVKIVERDGATLDMRVTERMDGGPDQRNVSLTLEPDRAWTNEKFSLERRIAGVGGAIAAIGDDPPIGRPSFGPEDLFDVSLQDAPFAMSDPSLVTLLYLVARGDLRTNQFDIWRATTATGQYAASSERTGKSKFGNFAVRAKFSTGYSKDTFKIDDTVGIDFEVICPDQSLLEDEWDYEAGLNHELLAFCGTGAIEIMSLYDLVKTGGTTYTAKCVRSLYDTRRKTHSTNDVLWIQKRDTLDADAWPPVTTTARFYKPQAIFGQASIPLGNIDSVTHTDNARSWLPITPRNLTANNDGVHPTWTPGNNVIVRWHNTSRMATLFTGQMQDQPTDLDGIVLQLRSYDGATLHSTISTTPTGAQYTLLSSYLVANVNADFSLRIFGVRQGRVSLDYDEIAVRKN